MVYNADKGKEIEAKKLPKDTILDGVIIAVNDGVVKNFVTNLENWKDPKQPAIEVVVEIRWGKESFEHKQVFTYHDDDEGNVVYTSGSNFGKFKNKYETLPRPGIPIKIVTNDKGFGTIKLD